MFKMIDHAIDCLFGYRRSNLRCEIANDLTIQKLNQFAVDGEKILCIISGVKAMEQVVESLKRTDFHIVEDEFSLSTNCEILLKDEKYLNADSISSCTGVFIFTGYGITTFHKLNYLLETATILGKSVLGLVGVSKIGRVKL